MSVDRLVSCLPLCGRCVSVGGVHSSGLGGAGGVFLTTSDPSDTALA